MALLAYPNVPKSIGAVLSNGKASMRDVGEFLSVEDVYDLIEITVVDAHNFRLLHPPEA